MTRLADVWRALAPERRTTALVSLGLFVSMLLPWYSKTDTFVVSGVAKATGQSLSAFQAFSFVEAAVLLVSAGVLALLFARAEGRDFQLPGGDGMIVTIAGSWAAILIFYRLLDKPGLSGNARVTSTVGVQWGIFIALLLALGLAYAGRRIRADERDGPPLRRPRRDGPGSGPAAREDRPAAAYEDLDDDQDRTERRPPSSREQLTAATRVVQAPQARAEAGEAKQQPMTATTRPRRSRPRFPPTPSEHNAPAEQMSFEDSPADED
jgi:hypothetical protein